MDEFTLAPEPLAPQFDFTNAQTPPFVQAPNQAKTPQGGMDKKQAMKLAIMLPLALKAGPGAVQGLLQGFTQAGQTQYDRGRQQAADARTQEQHDWQRNYQQGQLDNQRQTQQRQFLNDFATRVGSLDDPAAIDALTKLYAAQAGTMGIDASALQAYAQQYGNPTKLQQRAAEKAIAKLKSQYGEKWMEMGAQFTHRIGGSEQPVPFEQLLSMAGLQRDPNAPAMAAASEKPETRSLDVQAADALARGDMVAYERLKRVKKEMGQADDRPRQGDGGPTDYQAFGMSERLAGTWTKSSQPVREMRRQLSIMETGLQRFRQGDKNGGSQAVLVTFQKILDPTSVVRESEYARTTEGQAMLDRIEGYTRRLAQGGTTLTDREMAAMVGTAQQFLAGSERGLSGTRRRIEAAAAQYKIDPRLVFDDALTGDGDAPAAPAPAAGTTPKKVGRFEIVGVK
jgi:hypothetical protein